MYSGFTLELSENGGFMLYDSKNCTKCGDYKSIDEFYKQKNGLLGVTGECKECRRERARNYGAENKQRKNAVARSRKVDRSEYNAKFRKNNPDYFIERRRRLKQKNSQL